MGDPITIDSDALELLIERKMAEREAAARAPKRGPTSGCNCRAEGFLDRVLHEFGCPFGGQKPIHDQLFGGR